MKNYHSSSSWQWDPDSQPLGHASPTITTSPRPLSPSKDYYTSTQSDLFSWNHLLKQFWECPLRRLRHREVLQNSSVRCCPHSLRRRKLFKIGSKQIVHQCSRLSVAKRPCQLPPILGQKCDRLRWILWVEAALQSQFLSQLFLRSLQSFKRRSNAG